MLSPLPLWRVGWAPLAAPSPWYFLKAVLDIGMGGRTDVLVGLGPSPPHTHNHCACPYNGLQGHYKSPSSLQQTPLTPSPDTLLLGELLQPLGLLAVAEIYLPQGLCTIYFLCLHTLPTHRPVACSLISLALLRQRTLVSGSIMLQ